MRLPLTELYAMDLSEFFAAYDGWVRLEQMHERANLERTRWLAAVSLTPYSDRALTPHDLMPLPGDNATDDTITEEDFKARQEAALKLLNEIKDVEEISLAKNQD